MHTVNRLVSLRTEAHRDLMAAIAAGDVYNARMAEDRLSDLERRLHALRVA